MFCGLKSLAAANKHKRKNIAKLHKIDLTKEERKREKGNRGDGIPDDCGNQPQ